MPSRTTTGTEAAVTRDLTPMERWQIETSRQSSWDSIGSVAMRTGEEETMQTTGGTDVVGTDDCSWWPCEFVGGSGEA